MKEMLKKFWKRLRCPHGKSETWKILNIEWDGDVTVECTKCGAIKHRHLS